MSRAGEQIALRDVRKPGWGWFEDELLDIFAPHIGPYAVCVYLCLCRLAKGNNPRIGVSLNDVANLWRAGRHSPSISKSTIRRALILLERAGIVHLISAATNRTPAVYELVSLDRLALTFDADAKANLAFHAANFRVRTISTSKSVSGVSVGHSR